MLASLGCGNPTALIELKPGETVLDLGSGGGIDVLLSARRVGPTGKAYGLDMTDDMLALARENQRQAGVTNVEFLKGEIENIPLPDNSVDVIISNCVINLSADKDRVSPRSLPRAEARRPIRRLRCCRARRRARRGPQEHVALGRLHCRRAGRERVRGEAGRRRLRGCFDRADARLQRRRCPRSFLTEAGVDVDAIAPQVNGKFFSAFIRAEQAESRLLCAWLLHDRR